MGRPNGPAKGARTTREGKDKPRKAAKGKKKAAKNPSSVTARIKKKAAKKTNGVKPRGRAVDFSSEREAIQPCDLRPLLDWAITILTANSSHRSDLDADFRSVVARSLHDSEYSTLVELLRTSRGRYLDRLWSLRAAILARSITAFDDYSEDEQNQARKFLEYNARISGLVAPETMEGLGRIVWLSATAMELTLSELTCRAVARAAAGVDRLKGERTHSRLRNVADALAKNGRLSGGVIEEMARHLDGRLVVPGMPPFARNRSTPAASTGVAFGQDLGAQRALAKEGLGGEEQVRLAGLSLVLTRDPGEWLGRFSSSGGG